MRTQINVHDRGARPPPRNCRVFSRGHVIFSPARPVGKLVSGLNGSNHAWPNIALNLMDHRSPPSPRIFPRMFGLFFGSKSCNVCDRYREGCVIVSVFRFLSRFDRIWNLGYRCNFIRNDSDVRCRSRCSMAFRLRFIETFR